VRYPSSGPSAGSGQASPSGMESPPYNAASGMFVGGGAMVMGVVVGVLASL